MKNVNELREFMSSALKDLRAGDLEHKAAAQLANMAGKMITSAKVQIEYHALRKVSPNISFLADDNGK
jgi:hypothetical protein